MQKTQNGRWITTYSWPSGLECRFWESVIPRTSDWFLDCVIYIYGSRQAAIDNDISAGGSGFLAAVRLEQNPNHFAVYAVTAAHVIQKAGTPFLRLNRRFEDGTEIIEAPRQMWVPHQDADDVSVCQLQISTKVLRTLCLETERFATKDALAENDIGLGDDVFMVGRFAQHSGGAQNIPALRFGSISMMPLQPIVREDGIKQESFLVECRSVPGYSGSPVFVYKRQFQEHRRVNPFQLFSDGFWLLGIDWCHLHDVARVKEKYGARAISDGSFVEVNTGMAGVIPAWKILDIINSEVFVGQRREQDNRLTKERINSPVSLDSLPESEPVFTKQSFESALKKASRRVAPSKSGKGKK